MKNESQVKQKVKQVIFRHRKAYVQRGLAKSPENCLYNAEVHLPIYMANRATLRVCGYGPTCDSLNNVVCDSTMGGDRQAAGCPYFEVRRPADMLKEEFNRRLGLDGSVVEIGYIAKEYPDVAALMWVMGPAKDANRDEPPSVSQENILAFFGDADEPENLPERPLVDELESVDGDG